MLCFSDLGELGIGLGSKLPDKSVDVWLKEVLSGSAVSPVSVYSDTNLATIVRDMRSASDSTDSDSEASNSEVPTAEHGGAAQPALQLTFEDAQAAVRALHQPNHDHDCTSTGVQYVQKKCKALRHDRRAA